MVIFLIKSQDLKYDANIFYIILFSFRQTCFLSKLFNGTRILIINMFLLTKLMIDKIVSPYVLQLEL